MLNREELLSGTRPEVQNRVLITVEDHFEGYQVMDYRGMVWGISMRAKDVGQDFLMGCKQVTGGELTSFTELMDEARQRAVDRMIGMAKRIGANAVINFKFEQGFNTYNQSSEVTAFGNAVVIKPIQNYVPLGGLGNILAEFVDGTLISKGVKPTMTVKNEVHQAPLNTKSETSSVVREASSETLVAKLSKIDSQLIVFCPNCGMKYGTEIEGINIKVKGFADADPIQKGQQVSCINCGQLFTVPQKI